MFAVLTSIRCPEHIKRHFIELHSFFTTIRLVRNHTCRLTDHCGVEGEGQVAGTVGKGVTAGQKEVAGGWSEVR